MTGGYVDGDGENANDGNQPVDENQQDDIIAQVIASEQLLADCAGTTTDTLEDLLERFEAMRLDIESKAKTVKKVVSDRKSELSKAETARRAREKSAKESEDKRVAKEETVGLRFNIRGNVITLQVPKGLTVGKIRRRLINRLNKMARGKKFAMDNRGKMVFNQNDKVYSKAPRKTLFHIDGIDIGADIDVNIPDNLLNPMNVDWTLLTPKPKQNDDQTEANIEEPEEDEDYSSDDED